MPFCWSRRKPAPQKSRVHLDDLLASESFRAQPPPRRDAFSSLQAEFRLLSSRTCANCGTTLDVEALFCHRCGLNLTQEDRATPIGNVAVDEVSDTFRRLRESIGGERFERDIKRAAKLQHPHILGPYASGDADGLPL